MARVAVVGLGAMGGRIARRLLDAGHELVVWNRTRAAADELERAGASVAASPADAAREVDALITMLADPEALHAVTEGTSGVAAGAHEPLTVLEMSTVGPAAVSRLATVLPDGVGLLDAPVLGSLAEVESGSLQIFVGGPEPLVERWTPLLQQLGAPIHVGSLGSGAAAKLLANLTLVGTIGLLGETLALARALELSDEAAFEVLARTSLAAVAERRRASFESGEYPPRFRLSLGLKDADLIVEAVDGLRIAEAARSWLADAEAAGLGELDYSAVLSRIAGT